MSGAAFDDGRTSGVYPGQDWIDPDGVSWHVDAIAWDGTERSAFLEDAEGTVQRLPAALVARTFTRPLPHPEPAAMSGPMRVQLSRRKGARMPEGAVKVDRSGKGTWGNPFDFRPSEFCWLALSYGCRGDARGRQEASVKAFRDWIGDGSRACLEYERGITFGNETTKAEIGPRIKVGPSPSVASIQAALRGKHLACWCRLCPEHRDGKPLGVECAACAPCHADILLALSNRPVCDDPAARRNIDQPGEG